ncbi:MAG TPA: TonB-dependent receptor, partial [Sphingobacteriaceae bacterium]
KKQIRVAAGLGFAQLALLIGSASAQDQPMRSLEEVVVTSSRSPRKQSEIGKVVRVINREQLEKSQGRTLPEVLNQVAGLTISGVGTHPGEIRSVYLRGASSGNTLILLDGVPVNDASSISGEFDISAIPVDQIERIEILKGGNSTLYGSDAVAGVINIITRKGYGKPSVNLLATAGSFGTFKEAIGVNGQLKNTVLALNASNLDSRGFSIAEPKPNVNATEFDRDEFHQKALGLNVTQQLNPSWSVKGNFQYNNNKADMDFGAFTDALNNDYRKENTLFGIGAKGLIHAGELNVNISRNNVSNRFNEGDVITRNIGRITNADAYLNYPLTTFADLTAGGTYKYSETDQEGPYGSLAAEDANNSISSLFASFFLKNKSGLNAELGTRFNHHSEFGNNITYTLNPSYVLAEQYKFYINLSSAYKVPSLYQLYSEYGNLNLKPETSHTYEAGVDLDIIKGGLNVSLSYFRRNIDEVIAFGALPGNRFGYINQDRQEDHGFEFELAATPVKNVSISAFYAYVDGEITTPAGSEFNLFRRPKNSLGAAASVHLGKKVDLNLQYKWVDVRHDRYYDASIPPFGETVEVLLEPYHLLDAYIQYRPGSRLTLFTDLKNLLDSDYTEFIGFTTRGLSFNAGVKIDIRR